VPLAPATAGIAWAWAQLGAATGQLRRCSAGRAVNGIEQTRCCPPLLLFVAPSRLVHLGPLHRACLRSVWLPFVWCGWFAGFLVSGCAVVLVSAIPLAVTPWYRYPAALAAPPSPLPRWHRSFWVPLPRYRFLPALCRFSWAICFRFASFSFLVLVSCRYVRREHSAHASRTGRAFVRCVCALPRRNACRTERYAFYARCRFAFSPLRCVLPTARLATACRACFLVSAFLHAPRRSLRFVLPFHRSVGVHCATAAFPLFCSVVAVPGLSLVAPLRATVAVFVVCSSSPAFPSAAFSAPPYLFVSLPLFFCSRCLDPRSSAAFGRCDAARTRPLRTSVVLPLATTRALTRITLRRAAFRGIAFRGANVAGWTDVDGCGLGAGRLDGLRGFPWFGWVPMVWCTAATRRGQRQTPRQAEDRWRSGHGARQNRALTAAPQAALTHGVPGTNGLPTGVTTLPTDGVNKLVLIGRWAG